MTKSRYTINQWDLNNKLQLFLEQQTFEDPLTGQIKTQSLPAYVEAGMCNGYDMMLFRANLIGQTEQYFERLYLLNETSPQTIKQMGILLETYKRDFAKLSELEYKTWTSSIHKRKTAKAPGFKTLAYEQLNWQAQKHLTRKQRKLLWQAQDLEYFISSLVFSQNPAEVPNGILHTADSTLPSSQQRGIIDQDDAVEILKVIPSDRQENLTSVPVQLVETLGFVFAAKQELIYTLEKMLQNGDHVKISNSYHDSYLVKKNEQFFYYDSNSKPHIFESITQLAKTLEKIPLNKHVRIHVGLSDYVAHVSKKNGVFHFNADDAEHFDQFDNSLHLAKKIIYTALADMIIQSQFTTFDCASQFFALSFTIFSSQTERDMAASHIVNDILADRDGNININTAGQRGITTLWMAAKCGAYAIAKIALEHGADPNISDDHDAYTPAYQAAAFGHAKIIELLADFNADFDKQCIANYTPYDIANARSHRNVISMLKKCKNNLNLLNYYELQNRLNSEGIFLLNISELLSMSCLDDMNPSSLYELYEMKNLLTQAYPEQLSATVLYCVIHKQTDLLQQIIQLNEELRMMAVILASTVTNPDIDLINFLCESDLIPGKQIKYRAYGLLAAATRSRLTVIDDILEHHATALTQAQAAHVLDYLVMHHHPCSATMLLLKCPEITITCSHQNGNTVLHHAIINQLDLEFFNLLCTTAKAVISHENLDQKSALDLAIENNRFDIVMHLLKQYSSVFTDTQFQRGAQAIITQAFHYSDEKFNYERTLSILHFMENSTRLNKDTETHLSQVLTRTNKTTSEEQSISNQSLLLFSPRRSSSASKKLPTATTFATACRLR